MALLFSLVFGRVEPVGALLSLGLGSYIAARLARRIDQSFEFDIKGLNTLEISIGLFLLWGFCRHFLYLIIDGQKSIKTLIKNNLGDLPLHISHIRSFQEGPFPFLNPSYSSDYLRYPFGMNLYSSLWDSLGVPLGSHMFIVGVACSLLLLVLSYRLAGWVSWICVLLGGGSAGWTFLQNGRYLDFQKDLAWKNIITSMWVPQRGLLIGIPIGLLLMRHFITVSRSPNSVPIQRMKLLGFLWGVLPFFHTHSFVFMSLFFGGLALFYNKWKVFVLHLKWAILPGTLWILYATNFFQGASVIHFQWGWQKSFDSFFSFWFVNLGPVLLLFIANFVILSARKKWEELKLFALLTLFFFFFQFVIFSVWDWDNLKLLIWVIFGFSALAWSTWIKELRLWQQSMLAVVIGLTGAITLVATMNGQKSAVTIFEKSELFEAEEILMELAGESRILTRPTFNHPVSFHGKKLLMGFSGHLYSYGIDYGPLQSKIEDVYLAKENWQESLKALDVDYIYWGPSEKREFGAESKAWMDVLKKVKTVGETSLYKVEE